MLDIVNGFESDINYLKVFFLGNLIACKLVEEGKTQCFFRSREVSEAELANVFNKLFFGHFHSEFQNFFKQLHAFLHSDFALVKLLV